MKRGVIPGVLLLLLGAYLLIAQFFAIPDGLGMVFIGIFLIALRILLRRAHGLTIAGCLAIAVGLSEAIHSSGLLVRWNLGFLQGSIHFIMLALAFFAIHIAEYPRTGNWPIVPGLCLLGVAAVITLQYTPELRRYVTSLWRLWPVALICVGASMLLGGRRRFATQHPPAPPPQGPPPQAPPANGAADGPTQAQGPIEVPADGPVPPTEEGKTE